LIAATDPKDSVGVLDSCSFEVAKGMKPNGFVFAASATSALETGTTLSTAAA